MNRVDFAYRDCRLLMYKALAQYWPKAMSMGIPAQDLEREVEYVFVLALHTWRERGHTGNFHAYLKTCLHNKIRNFLRDEYRRTAKISSLDVVFLETLPGTEPHPAAAMWYEEACTELSQDAKEVIHAIFHAPEELLEDVAQTTSIKLVRGMLKRWLRGNGWSRQRVDVTFDELKQAFTP